MNRSTPGLLVHHQLPEFTQTHVHQVSDAIQPSHPLSSPSFPALNLSQHQGLFQWISSSHQVAKILEFQLQHQSFQRTCLLGFRFSPNEVWTCQGKRASYWALNLQWVAQRPIFKNSRRAGTVWEWKSWLKAQHSETEDHGIWSHHFMGNRWGNSGNSVRLYFFGLQNHCRWWLQPWN